MLRSPFGTIRRPTPLEDGLVARGETRNIDQALRVTVDHEGIEGWVNFRCVPLWGLADGRTSAIVCDLGGEAHRRDDGGAGHDCR